MKKLSLYILLVLATLFSCDKDETLQVLNSDSSAAVITSTTADLTTVITAETLPNSVTLNWDKTPYGVSTEVDYTIQIDSKCGGFSSPVILGSTTNNAFVISLDNLNTKLLNDLMLAQNLPADLEIRITSTINNNYLKTSEPVSFTVTPYSAKPTGMWLTSESWTNANAPALLATGAATFEGYAYLTAGSVMFTTSRGCENVSFGGGDGTLMEDGSAISVGTEGYYKINADTENLTYQFWLVETWGMIGTSTPGAWDVSSPLTYSKDKGVWEARIDLNPGALKFRANNWWDVNYGPASSDDLIGTLIQTDGSITITKSANYIVTIDFTQSKAPYLYTYSVVESGEAAVPTKLWLPGGYQDYKPDLAPTIYSVSEFVYDGYVYIGSATGFKFTSSPDWNHTNYGDSGTPEVLSTDGTAGDLSLSQAGYYRFHADVKNLTYSTTLINSFGMVGPATLGGSSDGWNQSVAMTYNMGTGKWSGTIDLSPGALKFRANNEWTINYGPADTNSLDGELRFDDPGAINITEAGNYTVTIDMSRTVEPYIFTYSIKKN